MGRLRKKRIKETRPRVDPELEGLEIGINTFGEIQSNMNIEAINEFLNRNLEDKKLKNKIKKDTGKSSGKNSG
jgi:hypothetical protein